MGKLSTRLELVTTKDFNIEFLKELKVGQVLGFNKDDTKRYYRVAKIDKKRKQWWFQPWRIYDDEEFRALERMRVS